MKAVLMSIKPKWCAAIANGIKTIEVRKTKPKIETPFKVYIYCSGKENGTIIGEFTCNYIITYWFAEHLVYPTPAYDGDPSIYDCGAGYWITFEECEKACLDYDQLVAYGKGKDLYGWLISNLFIYEEPKELKEFSKSGFNRVVPLKRPPQSWCYVDVSEGECGDE